MPKITFPVREAAARSFMTDIVIPRLEATMPSYVTDLVIEPRLDGGFNVYLVELNPLCEAAGSCLFTWHKDRAVLLGAAPYEFRINDKIPPFRHDIDGRVRELLQPYTK